MEEETKKEIEHWVDNRWVENMRSFVHLLFDKKSEVGIYKVHYENGEPHIYVSLQDLLKLCEILTSPIVKLDEELFNEIDELCHGVDLDEGE